MKSYTGKFDPKRINRMNTIIILVVCAIMAMGNMALYGKIGIRGAIDMAAAGTVALILYFLPINDMIKGLLICLVLPFMGGTLSYMTKGEPKIFLVFIGGATLATLYFNYKLLLAYGVILNAALIAFYITLPISLMGTEADISEFIQRMLLIDLTIAVLYFLTRWGAELVESVMIKEKNANDLLQKLKTAMEKVEDSTKVLSNGISDCNEDIGSAMEVSKSISAAVREIAAGAATEVASSTNIKTASQEAVNSVMETSHVSDDISQSIGEINTSLNAIVEISEQTNLLSLNASIEAARAGEAGRGFSVVATEVQKLADESGSIVKNISEVISNINNKSKEAFEVIKKGNIAVESGSAIVAKMSTSFDKVDTSFKDMSEDIAKERKLVDSINNAIVSIEKQISEIASISEEHSSSTEEIFSEVENQSNRIANIKDTISKLDELSGELKEMISQSDSQKTRS